MIPGIALLLVIFLLSGVPSNGLAFDGTETGDPLEQYQMEFKRKNLGPSLNLDPAKVEKLLQIDQKYRALKRQATQEARLALQQLQRVMSQPQPSEEEVRRILDNMMRLRQHKLALEQQQLEEEKAVLTPVQQARYILLLMNMRHQIAKEAQKVRGAPPLSAPQPLKPGGPREVPVSRPGGNY
jgi:Spy/CpxP family protein refolding chaperone|uniref:Periplasmic heavy metal sensor n=1 Tax=Desulfobacca acetoxidans TaxID=60893 RepID=A0A7V6A4N7_9BACT